LTARGGTNISAALERALSRKSSSTTGTLHIVIFITDGCPTVGETNPDRILELVERLQNQATKADRVAAGSSSERLRIFTFGVGHDVNTRLLDRIAELTRAVSEYVRPEENLEVPISSLFDRASRPAVTNLKVSFSPDVVFDLYPKVLPDLFYGDLLTIFGRYKRGGAVLVTVRGEMAGRPVEYTFERSLPDTSSENPFVEKLWATRKIGYLLDELRERGDSAEIRDEIIALSKKYGIVTPLTSFLVAEDVPVVESRTTGHREGFPSRYSRAGNRSVLPDSSGGIRPAQVMDRASAPAVHFAESGALAVKQATELKSLKRQVTVPSTTAEDVRALHGKTFVWRNGTWHDLEIESHHGLTRIAIQPFSEAYFEVLRQRPEWADWLSLGEKVDVVVLDRILLSVTPEGKTALSAEDRKQLGI
jgi:Ca-activated chloride channel family protein